MKIAFLMLLEALTSYSDSENINENIVCIFSADENFGNEEVCFRGVVPLIHFDTHREPANTSERQSGFKDRCG